MNFAMPKAANSKEESCMGKDAQTGQETENNSKSTPIKTDDNDCTTKETTDKNSKHVATDKQLPKDITEDPAFWYKAVPS